MREPEAFGGTESELVAMTADLDERHRAAVPSMYEAVAEWVETRRPSGLEVVSGSGPLRPTRRGFLAGAGLALGGVVLAACGSSGSGAGGSVAAGIEANDLKIAALATSLENLAVATYQGGIDAATAGKLGPVPVAVVAFAKTAQQQHKDHAAAWNAVITSAGRPVVNGVDSTVKSAVVDPAFAAVTDVGGLARLALQLEEVAAATYLASIDIIKDSGGIKTSASIHPVEMQHVAILNFILGRDPVPASFAAADQARALSDTIG
jgi:hypothetical protein